MKNKELLLKLVITLGALCCILIFVFLMISDNYDMGTNEKDFYERIVIILFVIGGILGIIMLKLMGTVKLTPKNLKSKRLVLNTNTYEEFEEKFFNTLKENKYLSEKQIPNNMGCEIKYLLRKKLDINDIILIIRTEELNENILNNYFELSLNYIAEKEQFTGLENTNLIHIICVDRVNDYLKKITETQVEQGYGGFNLPVGISFGSSTVYIAPQKGGFFIFRYKELVKMFKSYIQNQIKQELD